MSTWTSNPFVELSSSGDRIASWKQVRKMIEGLEDIEALEIVAEYWSYALLSSYSYPIDDIENWPSEWELVGSGNWCRDSVAVAMETTLRLAGWDASRLTIQYIRDYEISEEILILKIDDQYALNYKVGKVSQYPKSSVIVTGIWQHAGKKYSRLP